MFDIGFWELVIIGLVALVVIGPERLPGIARKVGLWVGRTQRFVANVKNDVQRELETENLKKMLSEQEMRIQELKGMVDTVQQDVDQKALESRAALDDIADMNRKSYEQQPTAAPNESSLELAKTTDKRA